MKSLARYIQEKLVIKKNKTTSYKYFPETKKELKDIISQRIKDEGNEVDLNDIDTSKITDMSSLFDGTNFNGDISQWDVSNVKNMSYMFAVCRQFNKDLSNWDVSNVTLMPYMFYKCESFDQDISNWDVSNVTNMACMFAHCASFNQDISSWDVSKVTDTKYIFSYCLLEEKHKPKFKKA